MIVVLVNAYAVNGLGMDCIQLFRQVPMDMLNESIYVSVLNGCAHCGLINEAREVLEKIPLEKRTEKIYTTMVKKFFCPFCCCGFQFLSIDRCLDRWSKSFV